MKLFVLSLICVLAVVVGLTTAGTVHGQTGTATGTPTTTPAPTNTPSGPPPPPGGFGGGLTPPPAPGAATNTPTATPTAVPTNTPIPLTLNVKLGHTSIKHGQKQSVKITSLAGASAKLNISFPGGKWTYKKSAKLGASGVKTYKFTQPGLKKGATNHVATVKVTVSLNGQQKHSTKKYKVS
jgi:hypothetical protein